MAATDKTRITKPSPIVEDDQGQLKARTGVSREVIEELSKIKGEPDWMRAKRLKSFEIFERKPIPTWGVDLSDLDLSQLVLYSPPEAGRYDFSFLAPCPSSGLIIHGDKDAVVPHKDVNTLVDKLKTQKGIVIEQKVVAGANHFFDGKVEPLLTSIAAYLDKRLKPPERKPTAAA